MLFEYVYCIAALQVQVFQNLFCLKMDLALFGLPHEKPIFQNWVRELLEIIEPLLLDIWELGRELLCLAHLDLVYYQSLLLVIHLLERRLDINFSSSFPRSGSWSRHLRWLQYLRPCMSRMRSRLIPRGRRNSCRRSVQVRSNISRVSLKFIRTINILRAALLPLPMLSFLRWKQLLF